MAVFVEYFFPTNLSNTGDGQCVGFIGSLGLELVISILAMAQKNVRIT